MPNTVRPQRAADAGAVAAFGTRDAPARRDALHRRDGAARRGLLLRHRAGGLGLVAVAVGLGRLGAQHRAAAPPRCRSAARGSTAPARGTARAGVAAPRPPRAAGAPSARRDAPRRRRAGGTRCAARRRRTRRGRGTACRRRARRRTCRWMRSSRFGVARPARRHDVTVPSSVADVPEAQPVRRREPAGGGTVARAEDAPGCRRAGSCPIADVDERADDRAHHLPAERGGADLVDGACRRRRRATPTRARAAPWSSPPGPCGRSSRSRARRGTDRRASRSRDRSSGSGTHHAYRARNGSGTAG